MKLTKKSFRGGGGCACIFHKLQHLSLVIPSFVAQRYFIDVRLGLRNIDGEGTPKFKIRDPHQTPFVMQEPR